MQLLRGLPYSLPHLTAPVLCLGTFDGLHLGHLALLERARSLKLGPVGALCFEPAPRELFDPAHAPMRLSNALERLLQFKRNGLAGVVQLRFNRALAGLSASEFVDLALKPLQPSALVIGQDFRFGAKRAGDASTLKALAQAFGCALEVVEDVRIEGERVSSTAVRSALKAHDFAHAARLLGRAYSMCGRVVRGKQLGRKLGFPTANVRIKRLQSPLHGIYAVRLHGIGATALPGVASIGTRPTVGGVEWLLETHLFDFDQDIYGRRVEVEFVQFLRPELKFESLDPMIVQMHHDAREAREALK